MANRCSDLESCQDALLHLSGSNQGLIISVVILALAISVLSILLACSRAHKLCIMGRRAWRARTGRHDFEMGDVGEVWWRYEDFALCSPCSTVSLDDDTDETARGDVVTGICAANAQEFQLNKGGRWPSSLSSDPVLVVGSQRRHSADASGVFSAVRMAAEQLPLQIVEVRAGACATMVNTFRRRALSESGTSPSGRT